MNVLLAQAAFAPAANMATLEEVQKLHDDG